MLNRLFGNNTHTYLHILGISGIAFALPWSKVMMSISVMFVVLNLILEGKYRHYWEQFKSNRIFWLVVVIYALNLVGLLWSSNVDEALHTIKQQLPFIAIPTVLVAKPIGSKKYLDVIFMTFLVAMLITSLYNFLSYQHLIETTSTITFAGCHLHLRTFDMGFLCPWPERSPLSVLKKIVSGSYPA